jgi:hypothetical protein
MLPSIKPVMALKLAVLAYLAIVPILRLGALGLDALPIFVVGCVVGAALLSLDVTLGTLVLLSVAVTMIVTISADDDHPSSSPPSFKPYRSRTSMSPSEISGFKSEPKPLEPGLASPPPEDKVTDTPVHLASVDRIPEYREEGPEFLRRPDGEFVTEDGLASAQTNVVGDLTSAYNPVGIPDMYTIQGGMSGLEIAGMQCN